MVASKMFRSEKAYSFRKGEEWDTTALVDEVFQLSGGNWWEIITNKRDQQVVRILADVRFKIVKYADSECIPTNISLIGRIKRVIRDYYYALDNRKHGGEAGHQAFSEIQYLLGMCWEQGKETSMRENLGMTHETDTTTTA